jgi:hypothetical protein
MANIILEQEGAGTVAITSGAATGQLGRAIVVTASPAQGYAFDQWVITKKITPRGGCLDDSSYPHRENLCLPGPAQIGDQSATDTEGLQYTWVTICNSDGSTQSYPENVTIVNAEACRQVFQAA